VLIGVTYLIVTTECWRGSRSGGWEKRIIGHMRRRHSATRCTTTA